MSIAVGKVKRLVPPQTTAGVLYLVSPDTICVSAIEHWKVHSPTQS